MAFENPFLKPSATRQAALRYLFSDEPESATESSSNDSYSIVDNAMGVPEANNTASNVIGNIANNEGSYNSDDGTDYSGWVDANPVEALAAIQAHKGIALAALSFMGIPSIFGKSAIAAAEQSVANSVLGVVDGFVNQYGGQTVEDGNPLGAAALSALPFGLGKLAGSDSVAAARGLVDAFGTTGALTGYFSAALDPTVGQITGGMFSDPNTITPAQYGTVGQSVTGRIQSNVANGMNLNQAQDEAIDFFNPPVAVSVPVNISPLPPTTPIAPAFADSSNDQALAQGYMNSQGLGGDGGFSGADAGGGGFGPSSAGEM